MTPPVLDDDLSFCPIAKPLEAKTFVGERAIEFLVRTTFLAFSLIDQFGVDVRLHEQFQYCLRYELRAIVRAQILRCAVLADRSRQYLDQPF